MSKRKILSVGLLILCVFPAYNIYKVLQDRPSSQSYSSSSPSTAPVFSQETPASDLETALSDAVASGDVEISFSDGTVEDVPVDERPLNEREDYPNSSNAPQRLSEIFIEDPAVVQCLQEQNPKSILDLMEFYCLDSGVRSLEGLQHFPNLSHVDVWLTPEAKPNFRALRHMTSIGLKGKGHSTFDFSGNPKLKGVFLNGVRGLENLDLSKNTALEHFQLQENKLTSLKLPRTQSLKHISVEDTLLTSLDLSGYPQLKTIDVSSNQLTTLKLPKDAPIVELFAGENKLQSFTVPNSYYLENLRLNKNPITQLKGSSTSLKNLYLSNTKLSGFDGAKFPNLKWLFFSGTPLKSIDISGNLVLTYLDLGETDLISLDVRSNGMLENLTIRETPISEIDVSNNYDITNLNYTPSTLSEENIKTGTRHPRKWQR